MKFDELRLICYDGSMVDITLRKALDDYITIYMAYRNFAERTRVEYQNDLEDFVGFLEKSGMNHVKELGLPIIERYVAHLEQEGLASLTRKRKVVAIRSFLSYLYEDGVFNTNIAKKIILPFTENTMPYILTQTECDQIRNASADSPRDRAIIELLLQTGIKLSELIHLTLNDIELETPEKTDWNNNGFIRILGGRGKKERIIPLNTKASIELKNYLDSRKEDKSNIVFLNRFGEPLGERGVQKTLKKHFKKAGVGRTNIHTLRHTFGSQHLAKGTSLKTIQEVMGLKDVRSTSVYQSLAKEVITREMQENAI
jgi:site-specific recombinase XerD